MPAPATDTLNHLDQDERRSYSRGPNGASQRGESRAGGREKRQQTLMDRWVEPALAAPKPSYQDHGALPYGVIEHMQPLGEAPNAKVKTRVKTDGIRKSVLGRSSAAATGVDARETPEGSPAPAPATPQSMEPSLTQQPVIVDDEKDADYAPGVYEKKRERASRSRAVSRKSVLASASTPVATPTLEDPFVDEQRYELQDMRTVVDNAKARAVEKGTPLVALAVEEIYIKSLKNPDLRILMERILTQTATPEQSAEFALHVKAANKELKAAKKRARQHPAARPNGTQEKPRPLPTPAKVTVQSPPAPAAPYGSSSAVPTTERPESSKTRLSLKVKSPFKHANRPRSGRNKMSVSPRKRAGSAGSDSSLTSLTSNEDANDMDLDGPELDRDAPGLSSRVNGVRGKDHAAERGSLAVPGGATKRSSSEADFEEDEDDRLLAVKKQKLNKTITRDPEVPYPESNDRPERSRSRVARAKEDGLKPPVRLEAGASRPASARGSRAASVEASSPLSDLSPPMSGRSTPKIYKTAPKAAGKRAKTKQSPEKKQHLSAYRGMPDVGGAGRESPIGNDDNEVLSENNDFCSACGISGYLLCCDGCDRSFHFTCLDPPLSADAKELDEPWYCFVCVGTRPVAAESPEKPAHGLFAPLLASLRKRNPTNFELPEDVRHYFEGVATDKNGSFAEALNATKATRSRPGYSEDPYDYYRLRDSKQNLVHCYACGKTSTGKRAIVTCDYCSQHWHLDCLDPPLANPPALNQNGKKIHDWMCPLHADQELRRVDMSFLNRQRRTIHLRRPKNPVITETSLSRGFRNNGLIEVADDETDASDSEFFDHDVGGTVYKLPAQGIKLDFIDKVKSTRIQQLRDAHVYDQARVAGGVAPSALEQANFAKRPFNEKQVALQLAQFASENKDLDLGSDQVENLVGTLIAEAPSEVVDEMMFAEHAEKAKSASSVIPPSPPASEQTDQPSAALRRELVMLQELIKRKLEAGKA